MAFDILFDKYLRTEKNKRDGSRVITEFLDGSKTLYVLI